MVAFLRVPPLMVNVLLTWTDPLTVNVPPERTKAPAENRLLICTVPLRLVTVTVESRMATSSPLVGILPVIQLAGTSQKPPAGLIHTLSNGSNTMMPASVYPFGTTGNAPALPTNAFVPPTERAFTSRMVLAGTGTEIEKNPWVSGIANPQKLVDTCAPGAGDAP